MANVDNKVVIHFRDGRILKGYTYDFSPNREVFHITQAQNGKEMIEVSTSLLKALFFVKSLPMRGKRSRRSSMKILLTSSGMIT